MLGGVDLFEGEIEGFRFSAAFCPLKFVKHAEFHFPSSRSICLGGPRRA